MAEEFKCGKCGATFATKDALMKHNADAHM